MLRRCAANSYRSYSYGRGEEDTADRVLPLEDCDAGKHKKVVKGLGFTRLNQIVEREDTPSIRGMVKAIPHLVRIVE